jgi:DNA polymerase III psi subunit
MNSQATFSLSDYQRATLTAMGITGWRQHETSTAGAEHEPLSSPENKSTTEQIIEAPSVVPNPPALTRQSLPEHILFPEHLAAHPFFTDILTAMDLQEKPRRAIDVGDVGLYSDYLLAWHVADNIALHETTLTTPELSSLSAASTKKQLWQALQSYKLQNRTA